MKMGIARQFAALLAGVSLLVAGLTGLYTYQSSRDLLVQAAKDELMTATQVIARRVIEVRLDVTRDLLLLASHSASLALLQGQDPQQRHSEQLAELFGALMRQNPDYFQIRLISGADHGLERVRLDRDEGRLLRVTGDDLQEKGHFGYLSDALQLPAGSVYLSRFFINNERGAHAGQGQPTAVLAAPVSDAQGRALGVIVINVDLRGVFARLSADLPAQYRLYLANSRGDFLIHPDSQRAFGFERGQRVLMQDEFPLTRTLIDGSRQQVLLESDTGVNAQTPLVAALARYEVRLASDEKAIFVGLARPREQVLARSDQLGRTILQIAGGFGLAGLLLALALSRLITRPLNTMSQLVQRFSNGYAVSGLPLKRQDEIGVLARSFDHMHQRIQRQLDELQRQRQELDHLARHDTLTGLANRRLFMERLDLALQRAQRTAESLAVVFIDVDRFKQINDRWGHEGGDLALKWVAQKLSANTRKTDTVARIGGDEFVLLLESPVQREQVRALVGKLQDAVAQPWHPSGRAEPISLSLGISLAPEDGQCADELLAHADQAMYQVKAGQRRSGATNRPAAPAPRADARAAPAVAGPARGADPGG